MESKNHIILWANSCNWCCFLLTKSLFVNFCNRKTDKTLHYSISHAWLLNVDPIQVHVMGMTTVIPCYIKLWSIILLRSWMYVIVAFELVNLIVKNTCYFSKHLAIFHHLKNEQFNSVQTLIQNLHVNFISVKNRYVCTFGSNNNLKPWCID
jgi:hypothetical protein